MPKPDEDKAYQAVQRQLLLKYIMSPSCGLFRQRQADIDMPVDDINHMLELGGAETLVVHLKFLDTQRMRFSGFSKMVDAVNESVFFRLGPIEIAFYVFLIFVALFLKGLCQN